MRRNQDHQLRLTLDALLARNSAPSAVAKAWTLIAERAVSLSMPANPFADAQLDHAGCAALGKRGMTKLDCVPASSARRCWRIQTLTLMSIFS